MKSKSSVRLCSWGKKTWLAGEDEAAGADEIHLEFDPRAPGPGLIGWAEAPVTDGAYVGELGVGVWFWVTREARFGISTGGGRVRRWLTLSRHVTGNGHCSAGHRAVGFRGPAASMFRSRFGTHRAGGMACYASLKESKTLGRSRSRSTLNGRPRKTPTTVLWPGADAICK